MKTKKYKTYLTIRITSDHVFDHILELIDTSINDFSEYRTNNDYGDKVMFREIQQGQGTNINKFLDNAITKIPCLIDYDGLVVIDAIDLNEKYQPGYIWDFKSLINSK